MDRIYALTVAIFTLASVTIVTPSAGASGSDEQELAGTAWNLVSLRGAPVAAGTEISLRLDAREGGGSGGCNQYSFSYRLSGTRFRLQEAVMSTMACDDPPLMDQEARFFALFNDAERVYRDGNLLRFEADEEPLLTFEPAE